MPVNASDTEIYLDNHATTPVDPRVREKMLPFLEAQFGNASSKNHAFGHRAAAAVNEAREQVARFFGAETREIFFTSGATEANNLAILGVVQACAEPKRHLLTQATEHEAVLEPMRALTKRGHTLTVLPVDATGQVSPDAVDAALRSETLLVSIMHTNNEIGTVQPLAEIARICRARSVLLHTDAAQAACWASLDVNALGVDLLSISAHKLYGPKGVGALFVRHGRVKLEPIMYGGGQERGLRSGTLNVPGIVGLGEACRLAVHERDKEVPRVRALRDRLQARITTAVPDVTVNGHSSARHVGNLSLTFGGVAAEALIIGMKTIAVSSGAACGSGSKTLTASHVLSACGVVPARAAGTVRFGVGRFNTEAEIDLAADAVVRQVTRIRELGE
jgi:cysteine desulfurase